MIFYLILAISILQFFLYSAITKNRSRIPKYAVTIVILLCYYVVLPRLFYPEPSPDGINCGLPIFAINVSFWVFGTLAVLITYIIWIVKKKIDKKKRNT